MSEQYHALVFRSGGISTSICVVLVSGGTFLILASSDLVDFSGRLVRESSKEFSTAGFNSEAEEEVNSPMTHAVQPDILVIKPCKARTNMLQMNEEMILEEA